MAEGLCDEWSEQVSSEWVAALADLNVARRTASVQVSSIGTAIGKLVALANEESIDLVSWCEAVLANEELEAFIEGEMKDFVRACVARLSRACGHDIDDSAVKLADSGADIEIVVTLTNILRLVRNLCVIPDGQASSVELMDTLFECLGFIGRLHGGGTHEAWKDSVVSLSVVLGQCICNMCVENEEAKMRAWTAENMSLLTVALFFASDIKSFKVQGILASLVHLLSVRNEERCKELAKNRGLIVRLLQAASSAMSELDAPDQGQIDVHATCVYIIGSMVSCGNGAELLATLEAESSLFLENVLLSLWLGHRLDEEEQDYEFNASLQSETPQPTQNDVIHGLPSCTTSAGETSEVEGAPELPNNVPGKTTAESVSADEDNVSAESVPVSPPLDLLSETNPKEPESGLEASFHALINYLQKIPIQEDYTEDPQSVLLAHRNDTLFRLLGSCALDNRFYCHQPCKEGLLSNIIDRLEYATQNKGSNTARRGDLLRIVANVCFKRKPNQDAVRQKEGAIFTVLNQSAGDDNSPYLREWCIFAVRNLTEGNPENQEIISQLRAQSAVNSPLVQKAGMRAELTKDGKVKLEKA